MMKRVLTNLGIALLIIAALFFWTTERVSDPSRMHGANKIDIHSTAGRVDVVGFPTDTIEVFVDGDRADMRGTSVRIERDHDPIRVDIRDIPNNSTVQVRVPSKSSVAVSMTAGQLHISGVDGDVASLLRSGQMTISVKDSRSYGTASASIFAGQIQAPVFHRDKAGLLRMFTWHGGGSNSIRAHVTTGQLIID